MAPSQSQRASLYIKRGYSDPLQASVTPYIVKMNTICYMHFKNIGWQIAIIYLLNMTMKT